MTMDAAGMTPAVRLWFVLYGPETAGFRRIQYETVTRIWAAAVAVMLQARRAEQHDNTESRLAPRQMVSMLRGILFEACAAEYAAAQWWSVPTGASGAQWARRQARTVDGWKRRWQGLAQERDGRVIWFDSPEFDGCGAAELLAREKQQRQRRWQHRH